MRIRTRPRRRGFRIFQLQSSCYALGKVNAGGKLVNLFSHNEHDENKWSVPSHPLCSLLNQPSPTGSVKRTPISSLNLLRMNDKWQYHFSGLTGFMERSEMLWKCQRLLWFTGLAFVYLLKQTLAVPISNHRFRKVKSPLSAQQRKTHYIWT
jgi:hypothetical protein